MSQNSKPSTTEILDWTPGATVQFCETFVIPSGSIVKSNSAAPRTTGANYDATEAAFWDLVQLGPTLTTYPGAGIYLYAGQTLDVDNVQWSNNTNRAIVETTFNAAEQLNWTVRLFDITERFANVADVRAATLRPTTELVDIDEYLAGEGVGGGNGLIVDRADTTTPDDGIGTFVTADGTRIKRKLKNEITTAEAGVFASIADNQTQLQALIDFCEDNRLDLVLHETEVRHSAKIVVDRDIIIKAYGDQKIFRQTNAAEVNFSIETSVNNREISFVNVGFIGGTIGLHHTNTTTFISRYSRWDNLYCAGCSQYGVLIEGQQIGLTHRKWNIENNTNGVRIVGESAANGAVWEGFRVTASSGTGLDIENNAGPQAGDQNAILFNGPIFEFNTGTALRISSSGVNFHTPWFETNGLDVELDSNWASGLGATFTYANFYAPNWSNATQATRIRLSNNAIRLAVLNSTGAFGGNNRIDGQNFETSSEIVLLESRLGVDNFSSTKITNASSSIIQSPGNIVGQGDISADGNLAVAGSGVFGGRLTGFRSLDLTPRALPANAPTSLGIDCNAGAGGGGALVIVNAHFGTGNSTRTGLYLLRFGFDGENVTSYYLGGSTDLATFSADGTTGQLFVTIGAGNAQGTAIVLSSEGVI